MRVQDVYKRQTWSYDEATGLVTRKTYADGTHEDTAYNALNLRSTLLSLIHI